MLQPDVIVVVLLICDAGLQCGIAIEVLLSIVHLWITRRTRVAPVELGHIDITPQCLATGFSLSTVLHNRHSIAKDLPHFHQLEDLEAMDDK